MSYLNQLFSLEGYRALVTGAGRGNGSAIAEALGKAGAELLLVDRDRELLASIVDVMRGAGLVAAGIACDLADPGGIEELTASVARHWDSMDTLVNNAGLTVSGDLSTYPLEAWETTIAVNLRAPFLVVQGLLPLLKKGQGKSIINITSINAEAGFPGNPAYVASKGGLRQLTKALALDLGTHGIRVNAIGPGYIRTAMTERSWKDSTSRAEKAARTILGRWGEPEDLCGAAVFLASSASSYVTGTTIYVDGGWLAKGL